MKVFKTMSKRLLIRKKGQIRYVVVMNFMALDIAYVWDREIWW